ncbi:MAG: hypothetical protein ABIP29_06460 [Candidatus Eisenbacteria bacterium]
MIRPLLLLVLLAGTTAAPARAAQGRAFVFATDFSSGTIASVGFGPPPAANCNVAPTCADAVLRYHQGRLYLVERFGCDNIRVLDPNAGFAVVQQFSVGNGSNPNDIVIVSPTRAFVTRYDTADLWIVHPQTGAFVGSVSLAAFADADGIPEMNRLAVMNGRVFVTVQRVDRDLFFSPTDSSQVVVLDAATGALIDCDPGAAGVQGILLPFQNPTTELVPDPAGRLLVGCTGAYGAPDGGIVRIDPVGLAVEAVEVTEAALGGDVVDLAIASPTRGFAIVGDAAFNTACRPYDRVIGSVGPPVHATSGFNLSDAEVNDRSELWLADRTPANPGIRVFDALTLAPLTAGPVSTCLPPQDLEFDGDRAVGIGPVASGPAAGGAVRFAGAWPNPSRGAVTLRLALGDGFAGGTLVLTLVDAAGRRVRGLEHAVPPGAAGSEVALNWDGRDDTGRPVAPGVYGVRMAGGLARATGRVVRLPLARL